jgi:single-strand DNA-binding protein
MRDKNEANLRGRLGAEAPKYTASNGEVQSRASFSICTNYTYVTKDGTEKSKPEWHRVVVWGKAADNAAKYLVAGQQVEVNGRIQNREYEDKEGNTRYVTEVVASNIEYGRKPQAVTATAAPSPTPQVATPAPTRQQTVVRRRGAPQITLEENDAF